MARRSRTKRPWWWRSTTARITRRSRPGMPTSGMRGRARFADIEPSAVIPGRRAAASPESILTGCGYGFRAPSRSLSSGRPKAGPVGSGPGMTMERAYILSFRLQSGIVDDLAPARELRLQPRRELGRRVADRLEPQRRQPLPDLP